MSRKESEKVAWDSMRKLLVEELRAWCGWSTKVQNVAGPGKTLEARPGQGKGSKLTLLRGGCRTFSLSLAFVEVKFT